MNLLLKAIFNLIMTRSIVDFLLFFLEQWNDSLQSIFVGATSLFYDGSGPECDVVFLHIIKKQKVAQVSASATLLSSSDAYEWLLWWKKNVLQCRCLLMFSFFMSGMCMMMMSSLTLIWIFFLSFLSHIPWFSCCPRKKQNNP